MQPQYGRWRDKLRYIGNKTKLLSFIESSIKEKCGDISQMTFCDLFAGTCSVSRHFKSLCGHIITNDLEFYSHVLALNYICNNTTVEYKELFHKMNNLAPIVGKITENFSPHGSYGRKFFTTENAMKIDAIRQEIENYSGVERNLLLCSLIESADIIANTTGVYGAYLKEFNTRAQQPFILKPYLFNEGATSSCYNEDANSLIGNLEGDILYLDPPYNSRQYSSNYHILNYIASYDFSIKKNLDKNTGEMVESTTGLSGDYNRSAYSKISEALKSLDNLIKSSSGFDWIFMSYNDEGIISQEEIKKTFSKYGEYDLSIKEHKRYKSNKRNVQNPTVTEQLHILKRSK